VLVAAFPIKSNLDLKVDVLYDLALNGPMHFTAIMYKAKIDGLILKKHLGFLAQNNLVEKQAVTKTETLYAITERGEKSLKWPSEIKALKMGNQCPQLLQEV